MATKEMNIESISAAMGLPWSEIRARLEAAGGESASHKELASALYEQFDGKILNHGWWVQGAVVAYEQEIGRRVPGQNSQGDFNVAVSRTVNGDRLAVIARFGELMGTESVNGIAIDGGPRTSDTPKRSYWRANLESGVKIEAAAEEKAPDKTLLAVAISKLEGTEAIEEWRAYFKEFLKTV